MLDLATNLDFLHMFCFFNVPWVEQTQEPDLENSEDKGQLSTEDIFITSDFVPVLTLNEISGTMWLKWKISNMEANLLGQIKTYS